MKGRRVTRRKKKRPARGSRRGGGIFNIFKRRTPVAVSAPVVASVPVAVPVPVPDQRINIHGMPYATPIKPRNGVPVAMAVGKPVITSFATPTANRVPNKKTLSIKNKEKLGLDLINAAHDGNESDVNILLKAGADVNAAGRAGWTALMLASAGGHAPIVKILLANSANMNAADGNRWTALVWAAYCGHAPVVEILLAAGADVNAAGLAGWTALMLAALEGHASTVELLVAKGADVNAVNKNGDTALLLQAAEGGEAGGLIVELLVAKGADVNAANKSGETALMIAEKYKFTDIVNILKAAKEKAVASGGSRKKYTRKHKKHHK